MTGMIPRSVLGLGATAALIGIGALPTSAEAFINVELRPPLQNVSVGSTVSIGLYAVSDSLSNQGFSAVQIIFSWQSSFLHMLANDNTGAAPLLASSFPSPDPYSLNESLVPQDGNAMYVGLASFGSPAIATPAGTLLTTLRFTALAPTVLTPVDLLSSGGAPVGFTTVFDPVTPNTSITGTLTGAGVHIIPAPAAGLPLLLLGVVGRRSRRVSLK